MKKGYKFSEQQIKNMRLSHLGHKASLATRMKMSINRSGEKNTNWQGGISLTKDYYSRKIKERRHKLGVSKRYYEGDGKSNKYNSHGVEYGKNWKEIRKEIYKRDNWTCQECGCKCHGHGTKDKIQCHHIDYDVRNNEPENLITLCASCHAKTNFRGKEDWTKYFKKKGKNINV